MVTRASKNGANGARRRDSRSRGQTPPPPTPRSQRARAPTERRRDREQMDQDRQRQGRGGSMPRRETSVSWCRTVTKKWGEWVIFASGSKNRAPRDCSAAECRPTPTRHPRGRASAEHAAYSDRQQSVGGGGVQIRHRRRIGHRDSEQIPRRRQCQRRAPRNQTAQNTELTKQSPKSDSEPKRSWTISSPPNPWLVSAS